MHRNTFANGNYNFDLLLLLHKQFILILIKSRSRSKCGSCPFKPESCPEAKRPIKLYFTGKTQSFRDNQKEGINALSIL